MTDQEIIKGLRQNDKKTIEYVYKTLAPPIFKYILKNSGTRTDGDDVFHETFIKVLTNLQNGKYNDNNKFEAYFIQIARNTWIDHLRANKPYYAGDNDFLLERADEDDDEAFAQLLLKDNRMEALLTVWKTWDDTDCQRRLNAFHFEDKSTQDIANTEGVERNTLLQQLRRCREKLFKLVSRHLKTQTK
jgi:RNA polymerase sigma factor (sigma-70 family)